MTDDTKQDGASGGRSASKAILESWPPKRIFIAANEFHEIGYPGPKKNWVHGGEIFEYVLIESNGLMSRPATK